MALYHARRNTRYYTMTLKNTSNHRIRSNNTPITQFRTSLDARANPYKAIFTNSRWNDYIILIKNWSINISIRMIRIGNENIPRYETARSNMHLCATNDVKILSNRYIVMNN